MNESWISWREEGASSLHRGSTLASHPAAPGLISSIPKKYFSGKLIDVAEVNQWRWLEERGQRLENVT